MTVTDPTGSSIGDRSDRGHYQRNRTDLAGGQPTGTRRASARLAGENRRVRLLGSRAGIDWARDHSLFGRIRAWMFVPAVDLIAILAPVAWRPPQIPTMIAMAVLAVMLLATGGQYTARLHLSVLDELPSILTRLLSAVAVVCALSLYLHQKAAVLVLLETACQSIALVIAGRVVTTRVIATARRKGYVQHRTILVGGGALACELAGIMARHHEYGLRAVGFVDDDKDAPAIGFLPRLGQLKDLERVVRETGTDTLLVADGCLDENRLMEVVRTPACQHAELLVVPRMHHFHTQTGMADHIGSIPIMRIRNPNLHGPTRVIKRIFDIVVASLALVLLSPVFATVALAVRMEGGPGVIFRQVRVGRDGKHFELLKFRSMRPVDEEESQTKWSIATDNRVGPVGRILRCTSIDELPQLWNILRGDMTLVGPRPERPHFVEQFSSQFDRYAHRHRVQVGLTGLAQVSGLRGDTSIADRARYDNFYIENWSLWLDIKIVLRTFREVVFYRER